MVGLGAGWSMLNSEPGGLGTASADKAASASFEHVQGAFAIVQEARLGSVDGLHLEVRNTFLLVRGHEYDYTPCDEVDEETIEDWDTFWETCADLTPTDPEFAYGGVAMRGVVPTGIKTDLLVDFGMGDAGAMWVLGGMRTWLRGVGDRGSVGVEAAAGYGSLMASPGDTWVFLYGPLVSVGLRSRW